MDAYKRYRCVLFDMDGTLVDSYEGIFHAYRWTMEQMGREFGGDGFVRRAIGAPLLWVFENLCGMDQPSAEQAAARFRAYYAREGKHQVKVYDGMEETLRRLKAAGCFLGTATLKREPFAKEILKEQGLLSYFDVVCGMDAGDHLTKADLVRRCMQAAKSEKEDTVLVGDSKFDAAGAKEAGVAFLAVTYGFGFHDRENPGDYGAVMIAEDAGVIADLLCTEGKGTQR